MRPAVVSGMSTGTRQSAVACWPTFSPAPSNCPGSLCESQLGPVYFSFQKWQIRKRVLS